MRSQHSRTIPFGPEEDGTQDRYRSQGAERGITGADYRRSRGNWDDDVEGGRGTGQDTHRGWSDPGLPHADSWRRGREDFERSGPGGNPDERGEMFARARSGARHEGEAEHPMQQRYAGYGGYNGPSGNFPGRDSGRDDYGYGWNRAHTGERFESSNDESERFYPQGGGRQGGSREQGHDEGRAWPWRAPSDETGQGRASHGAPHADIHRERKGPKGYARSDERIREFICERLAQQHRLDVSDVSVSVSDGCVTLEGTVPDRGMKHAIEDAADGCWGVKDVENRIRVASHLRGIQALGGDDVGRTMSESASEVLSGDAAAGSPRKAKG